MTDIRNHEDEFDDDKAPMSGDTAEDAGEDSGVSGDSDLFENISDSDLSEEVSVADEIDDPDSKPLMEVPDTSAYVFKILPTKHAEGICRWEDKGDAHETWIDATSGRASLLGLGHQAIVEAIKEASNHYLGDAAALRQSTTTISSSQASLNASEQPLVEMVQSLFPQSTCGCEVVMVMASADEAMESMLTMARLNSSESRYRIIALAGSDHGRTGMCRAASGNPDLHEGLGPMMAGFEHVQAGDIESLKKRIDDTTAAILISPIEFSEAGRSLDASYVQGVSRLCQEHDLLLLVDETRVCFGSSGLPLTLSSIVDVQVDAIAMSAGLFGGLPGGLLIGSERIAGGHSVNSLADYPLQTCLASRVLYELIDLELLHDVNQKSNEVAVRVAESIAGFEFVRDIHACGLVIGIETDLPAGELVAAAQRNRLHLEAAGETAVIVYLPLVIEPEQLEILLERLTAAMATAERDAAEISV